MSDAKQPAGKKAAAKKAPAKKTPAKVVEAVDAAGAVEPEAMTASEAVEASADAVEKATGKAGTRVFTPTAENKANATKFRVIAVALWVVAIALELVAIFWLLRPSADELVANGGFPQWRWWILIGGLVVIGALSIIGSQLWKKANHLDPASKAQPVKFFIQNQLGAFIAIVAFLPLIILIFLNKDMNQQQKLIAGIAGVVVAVGATAAGVDFSPMSQEQAAVEANVVTALTGQDQIAWNGSDGKMHLCSAAATSAGVANVSEGTVADALAAGSEGLALTFDSEMTKCGFTWPESITNADVTRWICSARSHPENYTACAPYVAG
jgi:hypothetical protein